MKYRGKNNHFTPRRRIQYPIFPLMKISDLVSQKLNQMGIDRPSLPLVAEAEKIVLERVVKVINTTLKPKLVARAFAATLLGSSNKEKGIEREAC